jgi:V8-like Glu-specific endopeptidase
MMDHLVKYLNFIALFTLSNSALAITDQGLNLNKEQYPYIVKIRSYIDNAFLPCTGTLVANRWILTAGHCVYNHDSLIHDNEIQFHNNETAHAKSIHLPPDIKKYAEDIALIKLPFQADSEHILFLNKQKIKQRQNLSVLGFGNTNKLRKANMELIYTGDQQSQHDWQYQFANINKGTTQKGDSGSPYIINNTLVAVHNGEQKRNDYGYGYGAFAAQLHKKSINQFILTTINDWHYPRNIKINSKKIIWLQSLHADSVSTDFYVSGDIEIIYEDSSCLYLPQIASYQICSLTLKNNGNNGMVYLNDKNSIWISRPS